MQLVIAEKPSVAQTIAKVLGVSQRKNGYVEGNDYIVSWCVGHLVGLAKPESYDEKYARWSFESLPIIPDNWEFALNEGTKEQYNILKSLMSDSRVSEVICATDAGREGECIFRYVYNMVRCKKPCKRLWVSSLEESAIKNGFDNLHDSADFDDLYAAGLARAKADWLVGMNATRLFTVRYGETLNIGRVQTPTLAMVAERDYKVKNFVKEKFFTVELNCSDENGSFTAVSEDKFTDENTAVSLAEKCQNQTAEITNVNRDTKTVNPPKLYDLTTLQREANRRYGYTAQQTLDYTQSLYEQKLCTYPRTDSQYITEDMKETAENLANLSMKCFDFAEGIDFQPNAARFADSSKVSDHTGLLPTAEIEKNDLKALPEGERNILYLIGAKPIFASAQPHRYEAVKADIACGGAKFSASGRSVIENGWKGYENIITARLKGNNEDSEKENNNALPTLADKYENVASENKEHWTSPPKAFTEDTLLSAMEHAGQENYDDDSEKKGLGTPATRAGIIENLVKRGYIVRNKKLLNATEKGTALIAAVPDEVKSPKMTSDWEMTLQQIEKGKANEDDFLSEIHSFIGDICQKYSSVVKEAAFNKESKAYGKCPKCGNDVQKGKFGFYCIGKCGMNIAKVYGKELTEAQLIKLLEGKEISYTANGKKTIVLPKYCSNEYNGKTYFQWETKKG